MGYDLKVHVVTRNKETKKLDVFSLLQYSSLKMQAYRYYSPNDTIRSANNTQLIDLALLVAMLLLPLLYRYICNKTIKTCMPFNANFNQMLRYMYSNTPVQ